MCAHALKGKQFLLKPTLRAWRPAPRSAVAMCKKSPRAVREAGASLAGLHAAQPPSSLGEDGTAVSVNLDADIVRFSG